jgi:hypothetical protein
MKRIFLASVMMLSCAAGFSQAAAPLAPKASKAVISFAKSNFNFGSIPHNVPATHIFSFTNTGTEPLVLSNVQASCGCTTPDWPKQPIAPGKKGTIKATFNAATVGTFTKSVTVMSNAKNGTVILNFAGEVKPATAATTAAKPAIATSPAPKKN